MPLVWLVAMAGLSVHTRRGAPALLDAFDDVMAMSTLRRQAHHSRRHVVVGHLARGREGAVPKASPGRARAGHEASKGRRSHGIAQTARVCRLASEQNRASVCDSVQAKI